MSLLTSFLQLFKYDPVADKDQTFNIETAMNENWEKIDQKTKEINDSVSTHLAENVSKVVLVTEPYNQTTKTTVNLGFRPKNVSILANILSTKYESTGYADELNGYCKTTIVENGSAYIQSPVIYLQYNNTNYISGVVSFTDTGIEITWSLVGILTGASGNRRLIISALTHGGVI